MGSSDNPVCPSRPLPTGFKLPSSYYEAASRLDLDLDPWTLLQHAPASVSEFWVDRLKKQYPYRNLIPFAMNQGSDDVACFDGGDLSPDPRVSCVHAFASPGWELCGEFENFYVWLESAESDHVDFVAEEE